MRQSFRSQPDVQIIPIEKIRLPLKRRDELPPILAGLQWVWMHPMLKAESFALLEANLLAGKQAPGRTGLDLWQILVLGGVRLGLDADGDRMENEATIGKSVRARNLGSFLSQARRSCRASVELTPNDLREITDASDKFTLQGARYPDHLQKLVGR